MFANGRGVVDMETISKKQWRDLAKRVTFVRRGFEIPIGSGAPAICFGIVAGMAVVLMLGRMLNSIVGE